LIFINKFGVYHNAYRSLISIYVIPVSLNNNNKHRYNNIFPITLSLYGFNFDDAVIILYYLGDLNIKVPITINGKEVLLYILTLYYISDIV
ncbi:hypothetical protein QBC46DRAFT_259309, partial [Diplogelasinospora grovesii]